MPWAKGKNYWEHLDGKTLVKDGDPEAVKKFLKHFQTICARICLPLPPRGRPLHNLATA